MSTIPFKKTKRETQRPIQVWVEEDHLDYLQKKNVNITELVREALAEAVQKLKGQR